MGKRGRERETEVYGLKISFSLSLCLSVSLCVCVCWYEVGTKKKLQGTGRHYVFGNFPKQLSDACPNCYL